MNVQHQMYHTLAEDGFSFHRDMKFTFNFVDKQQVEKSPKKMSWQKDSTSNSGGIFKNLPKIDFNSAIGVCEIVFRDDKLLKVSFNFEKDSFLWNTLDVAVNEFEK